MVPRSARVLVAAALVGTLLGVAVPATASPRPVPVCSPCDRGFTSAAHGHGMDVEIEHSTATMRVHRNGSATWTVENRLNDTAAATFARNDSLRRSVARDAIAVHDGRLRSTSVSGDTVRMRYRTPDVATDAPGGVLRVDYFRDDDGRLVRSGLGADRLTLVAPQGMVVGHALPGADVSSRRMTVTDFDARGDGPFVTLVPADAALAPLWSLVAIALPLVPIVGRNVLFFLVVPGAVFAGGLAALAWGARAFDADATTTPDRRALAVVAVGLLALAHPLYAGSVVAGSEPNLLAGGVGAVALGASLSLPAVRDQLSERRLAGLVAVAFALAVAVGLLLADSDGASVATLVLPLPVYAATLAGYTAAHTSLRRGLAVAVGALLVVLATTFSIASQGGTLYFLGVILAVLGALAGVVVGIPFFLLGYGLPGPD
ncbi:hypothetical protein [Haloplanus sp. C73]|uniref:hypothetical protein n=1 Tax=Haloplanus sp. C73 TaxID=3421641 RepID=UPI003EBD9F97